MELSPFPSQILAWLHKKFPLQIQGEDNHLLKLTTSSTNLKLTLE